MARDSLIQMRRDTAANWISVNPTLAAGEFGFETDTGLIKIGNGSTAWNSLSYTTEKFFSYINSTPSSGFDIHPRTNSSTRTLANGTVYFSYFTPYKTITVSNINIITVTSGTDSGGTTVRRMGIYTLSGTNNLTGTLVARTAIQTGLGTSSSIGGQTYALDATGGYVSSYTLNAGTTYAIGLIAYNTGGTFNGPVVQTCPVQILSLPIMAGTQASQTDLPATATISANISNIPTFRLT